MNSVKIEIEGMTCGGCASRITSALQRDSRISSAVIDFATRTGVVEGEVNKEDIASIIKSVGYKLAQEDLPTGLTVSREGGEISSIQKISDEVKRLSIGAVIGLPIMLLAMGPWHLESSGLIQFFLTTLFLAWPASGFFIRTIKQLRHGFLTMDTLVSIGMASAWVLSLVMLRIDDHHLYFESAVMIGFFVMLGKAIEERARKQSIGEIDKLVKLRPRTIWKVSEQGAPKEVSIAEAKIGDVIYLRPGDMLPLDGVVDEGQASFDESVITGESIPVVRSKGDHVPSGAVNSSSVGVKVNVTRIGKDTTVEQIIRLIEDARLSRPAIQQFADKISGIFVPIVMALSFLTILLGTFWFGLDLETSVMRGMSVLVVACPCALGLATPVAWVAGLGRAARVGVLVRNYDSLDALKNSNAIVFDKTGTLTYGKPKVINVLVTQETNKNLSMNQAFSALAHTSHPLARAVANWIKENFNVEQAPLSKLIEEKAGLGAICEIKQEHITKIAYGRPDFVTQEKYEPWIQAQSSGHPLVAVSMNGKPELLFELEDSLRADAGESIVKLKQRGFEVHIASGDKQEVVAQLLQDLTDVDSAKGQMTPVTKRELVALLQSRGKVVAFVGDGINDAPAIAAADVGISLGSGTDVAAHSAGLVLQRSGTSCLIDAIDLSHRITRIIRENFFWAFFYNVAAIPVAMAGYVTPMWAAAAMALSSVTVVLNALRLRS